MKTIRVLSIIFLFLILSSKNSYSEFDVNARYAIIQDFHSKKILFEKDADSKIYPASMTKIMTALVVFDLLKKGETTLDEMITISENAWRMSKSGYSSMFIMLNDQISVEDLLKGIIIVSGNDACIALAEGLAGTEQNFAILMNEKAAEIGMPNSNFSNSSGISDPDNYSTPRDILTMSHYLIKNYPEYYTYFKETTFTWDRTGGDPITQGNRNPLLYKNNGSDGIKTGFLTVEKYSLASSMKVGKRRIIAVGSGFDTKNIRSKESIKMLTWGLRIFDTVKVAKSNEPFTTIKVWLGKKNNVSIITEEDIYLTIPKRKKKTIKVNLEYDGPVNAPITKGQKLGKMIVVVSDEIVKEVDFFSNENINRSNIFTRLFKSLNYLVWGDV
jgi:serine-type D-Ala-D-Ala carboxypeptidase (penicillin-binding protein 5/6)